ncbi:hypothetical protein BV20DRAFT_1006682 [Pilatotrama ljubarskyi]|nr:hypothetical protein BV20DRAFT_1006682 [Pilatotrama ljubarskyi]
MAATPALTTPPPVTPFPLSSTKRDSALKPNPHPYAIKTTSTALLTRSNTSGYNENATRHYYVPLSPNPTRSDSTKGHRATKSLNSMAESPTRETPRPLPIPPALDAVTDRRSGSGSGGYVSADEASIPRRRPRRSETLPIIPLPPSGLLTTTPSVEDLPDNPKLWTPSQLATYLTTALRVTSGGKPGEIESIGLPPLVAKDIAAFVKSARIGGRTFLRMNEEDLEALGMNKKWRQALLAALRNLRQNVLKGRIWGAEGSPTSSPSPESASTNQIFNNALFNSSSSSVESSSSISTGEDEAADAAGAALGRSKARRYRNGRVRGMVETLERSGSFSSDGGLEDGNSNAADNRANLRRWARQEGQPTGQSVVFDQSPSPSRRRPLPIPPAFTGASTGPLVDEEEEPTMEALLASMAKAQPATGARAWEEMDLEPGVTVKRIPSNESDADISVERTLVGNKSVSSLGSGRGSGGSSKGNPERRVVTAIFSPAAAEPPVASKVLQSGDLPVIADEALASMSVAREEAQSRPLPPVPDIPDVLDVPETHESAPTEEPEPSQLERLLEAEIVETRALLDTFRARLEAVEQKVAELEANEAHREADVAALRLDALTKPAAVPREPEFRASVEIGVQSTGTSAMVDVQIQSDDPAIAAAGTSPVLFLSSDLASGSSGAADARACGHLPSGSQEKCLSSSASASASALQAVIPDVVRRLQSSPGLFSSSAAQKPRAVTRRGKDKDDEDDQPSSVSDLPSYVFLVGLGVCAVVLQVVLRKVVGRGAVSGWKP